MIRVYYVPVGGPPEVIEIEPSLEAAQGLVGGFIEAVNTGRCLPPGVCLFCNEEGIDQGLPPNGCGILGAYYFSAHDQDGDPRSLDAGELAAVQLFYLMFAEARHPTAR